MFVNKTNTIFSHKIENPEVRPIFMNLNRWILAGVTVYILKIEIHLTNKQRL